MCHSGVSRVPGTPGAGSSPAPSVFDSMAGDAEALEPYNEIAARYKDLSGTMSSIDASGAPPPVECAVDTGSQ